MTLELYCTTAMATAEAEYIRTLERKRAKIGGEKQHFVKSWQVVTTNRKGDGEDELYSQ